MKLKTGDVVILINDDGGEMTATVADMWKNGNAAILMPNEPALRRWFPKGYLLGSAHWDSRIKPVSEPTEPTH